MPKDKWRKERKRGPSRVPRETQDDREFKGLLEKKHKDRAARHTKAQGRVAGLKDALGYSGPR
jgi:hypothetical protein